MKLNVKIVGILYLCILSLFIFLIIQGVKTGVITSRNTYIFMLFIVVTRIVYLIIHELSHAMVLKIKHIDINKIRVYGVAYYGISRKWRVSLKEFGFSGEVIPWVRFSIDSDENFYRFKNAYIMSLLAGPILPFIIFGMFFLLMKIWHINIGLLMLAFGINCIIMLISSFLGSEDNIGDMKAAISYSKDNVFVEHLINDISYIKDNVSENETRYLSEKKSKCAIE